MAQAWGGAGDNGGAGGNGGNGGRGADAPSGFSYRAIDVDELGHAVPIGSSEFSNFTGLFNQDVIIAGSHDRPYTSCTRVTMDMCGENGVYYSSFGLDASPTTGPSCTTIQYSSSESDLSDQATGEGRKTPMVGADRYAGFNLILNEPEELADITGQVDICPGEQDYCIDYTTGYFYNWSITQGQEYATFISDSTLHCVTVEFTNATHYQQVVTLRVDVSPPCCPSYDYREIDVFIQPNVEIINQSSDIILCEGHDTVLFVTATMPYPDATYQWLLNGNAIEGDEMSEGDVTSTYTIDNAGALNVGTYEVIVSGACNVETTTINVSLDETPVVTMELEDDALCEGNLIPIIFNSSMDNVAVTFTLYGQEYTWYLQEGENYYEDLYAEYEELVATQNGVLTITSVVASSNGCENTHISQIPIILINGEDATSAGADRTYCSKEFTLEAVRPNGTDVGHWEIVSRNPASATVTIDDASSYITHVTVDQEGDYTFEWVLRMYNPCPSILRDTVVITINDSIEISFDRELTSCFGEPIDAGLIITGGEPTYTAYWLVNDSVMGTGLSWSGLEVGVNYQVVVYDTNECNSTLPFTVELLPSQTLSIQNIDTVCPNATEVAVTVDMAQGATPFSLVYTYGGTAYSYDGVNDHSHTASLPAAGYASCYATDTVYLMVTDANGCQSSDTVSFIITDVYGPVINGTIPDTTISCLSELPAAAEDIDALLALMGGEATITDNCSDHFTLTSVTETITATCNSTYHRTYTVTDDCNNSTEIVQNIIFLDVEAPVIVGTLPNDTIYAGADCQYSVPSALTTVSQLVAQGISITDCNLSEEVTFEDNDDAPLASCVKNIVRTYTVSDSCNNHATLTQSIVVLDTFAPAVATVLEPAHTYYYNSNCDYEEVAQLQKSDFEITDCSGLEDVTMTVSHRDTTNGGTGCEWSYVRVYSFVDACGNGPTEVTQTITVSDTTRPVVTDNLADTILYYSGNDCSLEAYPVLQLTDFTVEDCNEVGMTFHADTANGGAGCAWTITRVYTFTDVCNNASVSIDQVITVQDTTRPAISGTLDAITIYKLADCSYILPDTLDMNGLDAAGLDFTDCNLRMDTVSVTHSAYEATDNCSGQLTRTYEIFDQCGNSNTVSQTIVVQDTTRPVVTTVLDDTLRIYYTDADCNYTAPELLELSDFEVTDCCPDIHFEVSHRDTTDSGQGCNWSYVRVYTFTDDCGNAPVSLTQTIVVSDTMRPSIEGELDTLTVYSPMDCAYQLPDTLDMVGLQSALTIADCNLRTDYVGVTHSDYMADGDCGGHIIRTYEIFDDCGNSNTVQQVIEVTDTTRPYFTEEIPPQTLVSTNCEFEIPNLSDTVLSRVADNCTPAAQIAVTGQTPPAGTSATVEQDVTVEISDLCGNTNTITIHVTLPEELTVSITQNDTSVCLGESVTLPTVVSGGVAPYSYEWTPSETLSASNTESVTATPTDTTHYIVTVTDQNGCEASDTVTVNVDTIPQMPVLSQTPNVACHGGDANGTITIESPVPAGWYNYSLDDADYQDTTNVYVGLAQGPHIITVMTDATSQCTASQTITVENSPAIPSVVVDSLGDILLCPNQGTQEVTATIQSGLEPFVVTWEGAEISVADSLRATVYFDAAVCDTTYSVTVRIVDGNECDATNTYRFHVTDTVAPVLAGTMDTVRIEGCSAAEIEEVAPLATDEAALTALGISITDSCTLAGSFTVSSVSDTTGSCPIVVTRRYTVTDLCGNVSDTVLQVILVNDETAPVVSTTPIDTLIGGCDVLSATAEAQTVAELETIGFSIEDACTSDNELTVQVKADTAGSCPIVITRRYWVVDACGNASDTMLHTLRINDTVAPVISGSAATLALYACDSNILSEQPAATTVAQLVSLGFSIEEACTYDQMVVHRSVDSAGSCPIIITRTYWLTDACGNVSNEVTHTITIDDTTHPVWNEAITDTLLVSTNCEFVLPDFVSIARETSTDNCDSVQITQSVAANTPVTEAMDVTVTLTDACGNDTTYTIHVTLPEELTVSITQNDTSVCLGESVSLPTVVSGGVAPYSYEWTPTETLSASNTESVTATPTDTTHYVVTVTDQNGCEATDTVTVNVDTIPQVPVLTQEPNVACQGDANGSITIESPVLSGWYSYSINDGNSAAEFQDTTNVYSGLAQGPYTITVMTGAFSQCTSSQTITVESSPAIPSVVVDSLGDILLCPNQGTQEVTATIQSGLEPFVVTWEGAEVSTTDSLRATVYFDAAVCDSTYSVTVRIVDGNECDATNTYRFHVTDTVAPVLAGTMDTVRMYGCSADEVEASAPLAVTETALADLGITISDACTPAGSFTVRSQSDTTGRCPIIVVRRYTVTDLCGNVSDTVRQIILVNDGIAPTVSATPIDTLIGGCDVLSATAEAQTVAELETIGFSIEDGCTPDNELTVQVKADTAGSCPIVITRRYVAVDECGNVSDTMVHTLRINDTVAPVISGSAATLALYACDSNILSEQPAATTVAQLESLGFSIEEACTYDQMVVHHSMDSAGSCPITITRTYWLTDACGNVSNEVTHNITIDDTTHPVWNEAVTDTLLVSTNCEFVLPDFVSIARETSTDNCDSIQITQSVAANTPVTEAMDVTVTLTDACGNDTTYTIHVTLPEELTLAITQNDTSVCLGESVILPTVVSGGVAPYTYEWTPTDGLSATDADTVTATPAAGTYLYSVVVTDVNGCTDTARMTLTVDTLPADPVLSMTPNTICEGQQNGTITVESPVGTGYSYSLNNVDYQDSTTTYIDLETGDYSVVVMTAEGCVSQPVSIHVDNSQGLPSVEITHISEVLCPNIGSQTMTAVVSGGERPFHYTWTGAETIDDSVTTVNIDPAVCDSAYIFTLQVVDANNCTSTDVDTLFVRDTTRPVISGTPELISYNGCTVEDAPAAITTLAGLTDLGLTVEDNCTELSDVVTFRQEVEGNCPKVVHRYYTITDACHLESEEFEHILYVYDSVAPEVVEHEVVTHLNACDESAAPAVATNSVELQQIGFAYSDNCTLPDDLEVVSSADTIGHCPIVITRNYWVVDSCGNVSDTMTHIITIYDSVAPVLNHTIEPVIVDGCDTTVLRDYPIATTAAALEALGVEIVETCSEVTVHYTETVEGICQIVVTRTYTVEDSCGNLSNEVTQVITIQDTTRPDFNITLSDSLLESNNCEFVVPDYVAIVMNTVTDNCAVLDSITVLQSPAAGQSVTEDTEVTITVTDACNNTDTMIVTILMPTMPQLSVNLMDTAICQGSGVDLVAMVTDGTAPMTYAWSVTPDIAIEDSTSSAITVAPEEVEDYEYSVTVTDANGCISTVSGILVTVQETPDTAVTTTTVNTLCTGGYNGTITVESPVDGNGFYMYSLDGGAYQTEPLFENLASGDYALTVSTVDGCLSETVMVHVGASDELPSVSIDAVTEILCPIDGNQDVTAVIVGGQAPYDYVWHGDVVDADEESAVVAIDETVCDSVYSFYVSIVDANNCVDTARATVTVLDHTAPVVSGTADTIRMTGCTAADMPGEPEFVYDLTDLGYDISDNCTQMNDLTITLESTVITDGCPIRITRTYLLTDACGNVSDSVREYIVIEDNTAPEIVIAEVTDTINGCSAEEAPVSAQDAAALYAIGFDFSDECGAEMTVSVTADTSATNCPLVITRTYTLSDRCGNTSDELTHTIYIVDSVAPVISGTIDTVTTDGCDMTALAAYPMAETVEQLLALGNVSIAESCTAETALTLNASQQEEGSCPIYVTRTYTVTDECGNVSNAISQVIRIQDTTPPAFNVTLSDSVLAGSDCQFVVPDFVELVLATIEDNCTDIDALNFYQTPAAGEMVTENTTVTVSAEDECGNISTMTVNVMLPTTPSVTIPQNDTAFCEGGGVTLAAEVVNGVADYTYLWSPNAGLDADDAATVTAVPDAGEYNYTVTVTDANGCQDTASVTVTVHAVPDPAETISTENTLCEGGYNGSIAVLSPTGPEYQYSLDDIDYQTNTVFSELQQGIYEVYVISTYGCVSDAAEVEVGVSQEMPTVAIAAPDSVICPNAGPQTVTAVIIGGMEPFTYAWTGAEPTPGVAQTAVIAPVVNVCDTLYIFSVDIEDDNHCTNSVTDTIVVRDHEQPSITGELEVVTYNGCDVDVLPAAAQTAAELIGLGLEVADNCTPTNGLVVAHIDEVEGTCPTVVHRYYTVTDGCGNISERFEQILQVFDSMAPVVTVAEMVTNLNGCDVSVAPSAVSTASDLATLGFAFIDGCTDIADLQLLVSGDTVGSCPTVVTYKYVVKDACGNASDTMTHTITVFDSIAPVINGTIPELTVDGCDTTILSNYPIATTSDALQSLGVTIDEECSEVTVSYTETVAGECPTVVTRTYKVTDECGNVSNEVTQTIFIQDTTNPQFATAIDTQYLTGSGGHFFVPDFSGLLTGIISDDCAPVDSIRILQTPAAGTEVSQNLTATVTIIDLCGNADSLDIEVVIPDALTIRIQQPDTRFCFGDSVQLTPVVAGGMEPFQFAWTPATGLDADDVQNVTAAPAPGVYHYVVTVTDANGSMAFDSVTVTVDSIPMTAQLTHTDNTICEGDPNGSVIVSAPVGEGYSYSLNGGDYQTEPIFSGLAADTYTVTVQTEAGCTSEPAEITVANDINMPEVTIIAPDSILCPNIGTQEITAEITGGTAPFDITWSGDNVQASSTTTTSVTVDAAQCNQWYVITLNLTDSNNCAATATDTIHVSDEMVPTITGTIATVTYNGCTEADAPAAVTTPAALAALGLTLEDNCTEFDSLVVTSRDEVTGNCPVVINRYYTVTDLCGNVSEDFLQVLQVFDSLAPVVAESEVMTRLNGCDVDVVPTVVDNPADLANIGFNFNDACTEFDDLQVFVTENQDSICPIIITRKYVVKDECGNVSDTMTHIITVFDSAAPVIDGTIADVALNGCDTMVLAQRPVATTVAELVALGGITIDEVCSEEYMTVQSSQTVTEGCPIMVVRTYTVTDRCGNVSNEVTETILIQDTTAPVFAAQVEEHLLVSADCQFVVPDLTEEVRAVSSDNCTTDAADLDITQNPAAGTSVTADMTVDVTVTDACQNNSVMTIQLRLPEVVTLAITPSTTQYCEWDTVELSAVPEGGNGEYTYAWMPATGLNSTTDSTVQVATINLQYSYELTVTDGNGCTATATYTLPEPSHLTVTAVVQSEINCFEGSDGVAVATAANGVEEYTYVWNTGATQAENADLAAGTYTVTATDAYGCTATAEITLEHPTALTATVNDETAVLCFGDANGSGTVTPDGGTAPYIVSIDNNTTTYDVPAGESYTFTQLAAGTYDVLVTDANGCTFNATLTVTSPEQLQMTAGTITMPLCNQGDDGSAVVNVTGGTLPYVLTLDGTEVATMDAEGDQLVSNLAAGTYTVVATDANGCSIEVTFTVDEPELLTLTQVSTENVSCNGLSDATATVTFAGGTAPFTLYVDGDQQETTAQAVQNVTFTGLAAGTHTVGIRDANGCVTTLPVTITEPEVLAMTAGNIVDVLCFGDANGSAVVTPTGGTAPYTISVDNFATTQTVAGGATGTFADLTAGDYTAAVRDANGCETTVDFTIGTPTALELTEVSTTDPLCFGDANGSIVVNLAEGTAPYSLTVNGTAEAANLAAGDYTISDRPDGSYTIVATDANGCTMTITSVLGEPAQLALTEAATTPITCFGGDDGTATVAVTGGTAGYSVWMDDNQQPQTLADANEQATFTGLNGGDHVFTVTDDHNCQATLTINFVEPDPMSRVVEEVTDVVCYGQNNGTATVTISGGTLPYMMTVSEDIPVITLNTEDPYTITGLWADVYTVSIEDAHGCTVQMEITVQQPDSLSALASVLNNVDCFGTLTGVATVTPEGGIPPYSYTWTGDKHEQTIDSLAAGLYFVTVTDANGCTASDSTDITEPDELTLTLITLTESCNGEPTAIIEIEANGGTPEYTLVWSNGMEGLHLDNLAVGSYTVTVTDQHNCFDTMTVVVPFHPLPDFTVSTTPAYCERADGTATVMGSNLGDYTYDWNTTPNPNAPVNNQLAAGDYVLVVDDGVCTLAIPFTIDHIPGPTAIFTANPTSFMEGHTVRYNDQSLGSVVMWEYDFGDGAYASVPAASHEYNVAGEYWTVLTVTDQHNCVDTASVLITVIPDVVIYVPNAFTPNADGVNDVWLPIISNYGDEFFEVVVYSRWGELLFRSNDPNVGWNGKHNGKLVEAGVFTYKITYGDLFNNKYVKTGTVTVVR